MTRKLLKSLRKGSGCNGKGMPESFTKLFAEYDVYSEQGDAWNLSLYPNGDSEDYEYTDYTEYERL